MPRMNQIEHEQARAEIIRYMRLYHRGLQNAVPRKEIYHHLHHFCCFDLCDRTFRRIYRSIPSIGYSCRGPNMGIYWMTRDEEFQALARSEGHRAGKSYKNACNANAELERRHNARLPFPPAGKR